MTIPFLLVLLTYLAIGLGFGIFFYYVFRKPFIGGFWGYTVLGILGAALGGLLDFLLKDYWKYLTNLFGLMNVIPPLIFSALLIWIAQSIYNARDD
ncbi:MAG: hypothetical protein KA771_10995 [Spirochaetales bacterium]|nr:hypothetical protein [Spirochaetales bacterium]